MTSQHHDLWADLPEWEREHNPGQVLDWWREAAEVLSPLSRLVDRSLNEALQTAIYSAENRVREQVERWEAEVWTLLDANMGEGRLTPFGEVLSPLLERAGLTPQKALVEAGRIEEPNAALGVKEAGVVLRYIAQARARGLGVVFITHNIHHAYPIGDRFTLLNRGQSYGTFAKSEVSREEVVAMMAGGEELEELSHELAEFARTDEVAGAKLAQASRQLGAEAESLRSDAGTSP
ncbi:MAG: hypothetical protein ACRDTR_15210 [Rubrobacter sp.]